MHIPSLMERWGSRRTSGGWTDPWGSQLTLVYLIPCHGSAVDVVQCLCGRSQVCMSMISLGDLPHTCSCTWYCLQIKVEIEEGLYWFKNQGVFIQNQFFLFFYIFTMRPSSNKADMPWLTFPFESSSMTYPFGFENSYKG